MRSGLRVMIIVGTVTAAIVARLRVDRFDDGERGARGGEAGRRLAAEADVVEELARTRAPTTGRRAGYSQIVVSGGPISGSIR